MQDFGGISASISGMDLFALIFTHGKMYLRSAKDILSEAEVYLDIFACIWYNKDCRAKHV